MKKFMFVLRFLLGIGLVVGISTAVFASTELSLTTISGQVSKAVSAITVILTNIALVAGIGFVLASLFKFKQHKDNPTQVPIANGVTLLLIGSALLIFPTILGTTKRAAFGTKAKINTLSGSQIKHLINPDQT